MAIACCFIHQEVKLEMKIIFSSLVNKMKCLSCMRCFSHIDDDYVYSLRYTKSRNGHSASIGTIENQTFVNNHDRVLRKSKHSIVWPTRKSKLLCCLFDNHEPNDFFRQNSRKSISSIYRSPLNRQYLTKNMLKLKLFKSS